MQKLQIFFFLLLFSSEAIAQKEDYQWRIGVEGFIDFNKGYADTFSIKKANLNADVYVPTNSSVCDSNGNLLFFTNGFGIFNNKNDYLKNGDSINTPSCLTCRYNISGGCIILQRPNHPEQYYLFHQTFDNDSAKVVPYNLSNILYMSIIDMTQDSGRGAVLKKNIHLWKNDTLVPGKLAAVRHGNGRDWWLIAKKMYKPVFYKWLITPDTILGPYFQSDQPADVSSWEDGAGQAVFSPLGDKYAITCQQRIVYVYNFDRCTAKMTFVSKSPLPSAYLGRGCAFSPSGRFLYAGTTDKLYQFDLWSADISSSRVKVGEVDTSYSCDGNYLWFYDLRLAPDGKIYLGTHACISQNDIHVIEYPDSAGFACGFKYHDFRTASYGAVSFPNLPDYKLGRDFDSPCDTLTSVISPKPKSVNELQVFPNPAKINSEIILKFSTISYPGELLIYDITGRLVAGYPVSKGSSDIKLNISGLMAGIYFARLTFENEEVCAKFIVE